MSKLIGNVVFGQSGGPTSVINASAAGVMIEALKQKGVIERVFGAANGIVGILNEKLYDINLEDIAELELLKFTPSSELGSCRYKLKDAAKDETDYKRILEVFQKFNIRYFFYNGGNDSMDTCNKISKYLQKSGYECRVIGVPKTVDNDLFGTDHCPGYGSAAKYVATSCMEIYNDAKVYDTNMICVIETMGRHAGWLAASSALAAYKGKGPDLIYLPEVDFDLARMVADVRKIYDQCGQVIIVVSEGVHTADGKVIPELVGEVSVDSFGHKQLGGTASVLATYLKDQFGCKVRGIEFSLLQRCAAHVASRTDYEEAFLAGEMAVQKAVEGMSDYMVGFEREKGDIYQCHIKMIPLADVANTESTVPREWINEAGNNVNEHFINYALPLIQGETELPREDGLPRFARLKKIIAKP